MERAEERSGGGADPAQGQVLVVEDDHDLRKIVVRLLKRWGYAPLEASDGGLALERVRSSPDGLRLMLLDIMLPVLDGIEVARRVKAERPDLPIVACSAAFNEEVEGRLRRLGVEDFLAKPYSGSELHAVVEKVSRPTLH